MTFQSTPSAWRETSDYMESAGEPVISIHSLRMEGDKCRQFWAIPYIHFNPLPPHGGRLHFYKLLVYYLHFNPLPPHGGRHCVCIIVGVCGIISIHSLRMEGDLASLKSVPILSIFQSTPSAWRETIRRGIYIFHAGISIHSLRMEGDYIWKF